MTFLTVNKNHTKSINVGIFSDFNDYFLCTVNQEYLDLQQKKFKIRSGFFSSPPACLVLGCWLLVKRFRVRVPIRHRSLQWVGLDFKQNPGLFNRCVQQITVTAQIKLPCSTVLRGGFSCRVPEWGNLDLQQKKVLSRILFYWPTCLSSGQVADYSTRGSEFENQSWKIVAGRIPL